MQKIKQTSITLPPDIRRQCEERAAFNRRSLSAEIVCLIEAALDMSTQMDKGLIAALLKDQQQPES